MTEDTTETKPDEGKESEKQAEQTTFTQADVDRIVRERVKRTKDQFADYDELKTKAAGATTLEERVAQIERQARDSEARAMRAEVANAKGLTPSQAKRLIGETREELEADADDLLKDIGAQKKQGNHVPREGNQPKSKGEDEPRAFVRELFGRANVD